MQKHVGVSPSPLEHTVDAIAAAERLQWWKTCKQSDIYSSATRQTQRLGPFGWTRIPRWNARNRNTPAQHGHMCRHMHRCTHFPDEGYVTILLIKPTNMTPVLGASRSKRKAHNLLQSRVSIPLNCIRERPRLSLFWSLYRSLKKVLAALLHLEKIGTKSLVLENR